MKNIYPAYIIWGVIISILCCYAVGGYVALHFIAKWW